MQSCRYLSIVICDRTLHLHSVPNDQLVAGLQVKFTVIFVITSGKEIVLPGVYLSFGLSLCLSVC